jgi:ATP-dependent helicase YprA (DUF1998 family)
VDVDYYTQPLGGTDVDHIDHQLREKRFGRGSLFYGEVTAAFQTYAYERIRFYTLDAISFHPLDLPRFVLETMALWLVPDEDLLGSVLRAGLDPHSGLRGIGYATRMILPLFVRCDTLDFSHSIGCRNAPWHTVFVYERYPLGLGYTQRAFEVGDLLFPAVLDHVRNCDCEDGCPCCVGKPLRQLTTWNVERGEGHIPSRKAAIMILESVLGDGAALAQPEVGRVASEPEPRLITEHSLRRRLERMREPQVFHQVEYGVETAFPTPEDRESLSSADIARRAFRRRKFDRGIRGVRTSETGEPREPIPSERLRERLPDPVDAQESIPTTPPAPPIQVGNSLANRVRRRRPGQSQES